MLPAPCSVLCSRGAAGGGNPAHRFPGWKHWCRQRSPRRRVSARAEQAWMDAGTVPATAAKRATSSVPIVMANVGDPVGAGLVVSLARPGGNVTGLSGLLL